MAGPRPAHRRGRVLGQSDASGDPATRRLAGPYQVAASDRIALLLVALPLFGQVFHYMIDAGPFYYLSKAWPFLTLPAALYGMLRLGGFPNIPYLLVIGYVIGFTPILSMFYLGNSAIDAFGTTVKVWPFTYYFSVLALLMWLRPSTAAVERAFVVLGATTFVAMWFLWVAVPPSWYSYDPTVSKLFMLELERGYRIYMPMAFGVILMLWAGRRLWATWRLRYAAIIAVGLFSMFWIYKQRVPMAAVVLVLGWSLFLTSSGWRRAAIGMATALAGAVGAFYAAGKVTDQFAASLGASLSVRQHSVGIAIEFLSDGLLRWIFGVGASTRFSSVTLAEIFGSENFYLADIGWIGVIFEYGIIGALLILSLYFVGIREGLLANRTNRQPIVGALLDYVVFLLVTTAIYSAVFTPGELATVTALLLYLGGRFAGRGPRPA